MNARWLGVGLVTGLLSLAAMNYMFMGGNVTEKAMAPGIGNVETLLGKYEGWKKTYQQSVGDQDLVIGLGYVMGLSKDFSEAIGQMDIDLTNGEVSVQVQNLPESQDYEVVLMDSPNNVHENVETKTLLLGGLVQTKDTWELNTTLDKNDLRGFEIDQVVVTKAGMSHHEGIMIVGSPSLFQKLYYNELRQPEFILASTESSDQNATEDHRMWIAPFQALIPEPAFAGNFFAKKYLGKKKKAGGFGLDYMVKWGEELFLNETFDGNGRTCASCHSPLNNFTVDAKFMAGLPDKDPLFVAEFVSGLETLERPELMRNFGLILENVDGFPPIDGRMRSTPHTLALMTSLVPDPVTGGAGIVEAVGWSGDGAPAPVSLNTFATGAVNQHFPTTLPRTDSTHRNPTQDELDAMEAFQLSLGRQADPNLLTLVLKGTIPTLGQRMFTCSNVSSNFVTPFPGPPPGGNTCEDPQFGDIPAAKCDLCHFNGGTKMHPDVLFANTNANLNTNVEPLHTYAKFYTAFHSLDSIPCDGGFGNIGVDGPCGQDLGNGRFNTPPAIEAPDTAPYFHNNGAQTLEEAIAFYNGGFNVSESAFQLGFGGFGNAPIALDSAEIGAIAAFLRTLNSLENIRSALHYEKRALYQKGYKSFGKLNGLIDVAYAENQDAYEMLEKIPEFLVPRVNSKRLQDT